MSDKTGIFQHYTPGETTHAVAPIPQQLDVRTLISSILKTQRGVRTDRMEDIAQDSLRWLEAAGVALYLDGEPFRVLERHSPQSLRILLDEKKVFTDD